VIYTLLAPNMLWGGDSLSFLYSIQTGGSERVVHVLYLPAVTLLARWGDMFGLDAFLSLRAASTLSTSLGLWALHQAARNLGAGRRRAAGITLAIAATPAVAFFGMVVEVQGVFFGFAALAWLAVTHCIRHPGIPAVLILGLCTSLASMMHSSGQLLPLLLGVFALIECPALRRRWLVLGLAGTLAHVTVLLACNQFAGLPVLESLRASFAFVDVAARLTSPLGTSVSISLHEWLIPYAPLCLVAFAAVRNGGSRSLLIALHIVLLVYTAIAWPLLAASWGGNVMEHGGYFLPLAFPLAWLAIGPGDARRAVWLAPTGFAVALILVWGEAIRQSDRFPTEDVIAAAAQDDAIVLTHSSENVLQLMLSAPGLQIHRIDQTTGVAAESQAIYTAFDRFMERAVSEDRRVLMTDTLRSSLERNVIPLWSHVRKQYALQPRNWGAFSGYFLVAR